MGQTDTAMGGGGLHFPSTSLSLILGGEDRESRALRHFERLSQKYWKPIYFFIRRAWSKTDADAKDLTQSFMIHLMEYDLLGRFDSTRGNFRSYLKHCLRTFLATENRDAGRLKRGGGRALISFEGTEGLAVPAPQGSVEDEFDRDWTNEVVGRCLQEVEAHFRGEGKGAWFDAFRLAVLGEGEPSYRDVAEKLGISESDVRNHLRFVRQELRTSVLRAISEYVVDPGDIATEASRILGEE